ncbi:deoxycytidyl transferase [Podila epigama]|nr:deoxycytidyl transferase [Podila epigama]
MAQESNDDPFQAIGYGDFGTYFKNKRAKLQLQFEETASIDDRSASHYKVAKPEWITESVKANRLLAWHKFSTLRIPTSAQTIQFPSQKNQSEGSTPKPPQIPVDSTLMSQTRRASLSDSQVFITQAINPSKTSPVPSAQEVEQDPDDMDWTDYGFDNSMELTQVMPNQESPKPVETEVHQEVEEEHTAGPTEEFDEMFDDLDPAHFTQNFSQDSPIVKEVKDSAPSSPPQSLESGQIQLPPPPSPLPPSPPPQPPSANNLWVKSGTLPNPFNVQPRLHPPIASVPGEDATQGFTRDEMAPPEISENDTRHSTLIELSVPWNRLNSSVMPGFVEKFYQSSRLHYLSTWKARLREVTAEIQKNHVVPPSKHIDFDCFFASVATRGKPELLNKPIAVAHGTGGSTSNSEIASCNYLARHFGVKNGMQLMRARTLCSDLIVVPYEFQQYEDISIEFYKILLSYADELQAVSVDEALVDVTSKCTSIWEDSAYSSSSLSSSASSGSSSSMLSTQPQMDPGEFAQRIRDEIWSVTGCHASIGIGPNILLAKLSTKRAKPHGQYIWPSAPGSDRTLKELQGDQGFPSLEPQSLTPEQDQHSRISLETDGDTNVDEVLGKGAEKKAPKALTVKDLPGVGYKTAQELVERFNVHTLYELQQIPKESLQTFCGMKTGGMLYNSCRGIDETTLSSDRDKTRQSVSAEISWGVRFENQQQLEVFIHDLSVEVSKRLKDIERVAKAVVVKVMKRNPNVKGHWKHLGHGPCDQYARTGQLPRYTDDPEVIAREVMKIMNFFRFDVLDLRGIGIQLMKLSNETINFSESSSAAYLDTKNQTTISSMFQAKSSSTSTVIPKRAATTSSSSTSSEPRLDSNRPISPKPQPQTRPSPPPVEPAVLPTLEIDRTTFNELPVDIQDELRRHNNLVLLDCNGPGEGTISQQKEQSVVTTPVNDDDDEEAHAGDVSAIIPPSQIMLRRDHLMSPPSQPFRSNGQGRPHAMDSTPAIPATLPPWSQLDPAELAALSTPAIRRTLHRYADRNQTSHEGPRPAKAPDPDPSGIEVLPSQSKLDMSVLEALPKEIRDEIEREYSHIQENQRLIQQIVHEPRTGSGSWVRSSSSETLTKAQGQRGVGIADQAAGRVAVGRGGRGSGTTRGRPRGRPRGVGRGGRGVAEGSLRAKETRREEVGNDGVGYSGPNGGRHPIAEHDVAMALRTGTSSDAVDGLEDDIPSLDPDFLIALPPDIRAEIERDHKVAVLKHRQKMQEQKRLNVAKALREGEKKYGEENRVVEATIERPTLMGLHEVGPLRQMLSEWVKSTLVQVPQKPYPDKKDENEDEHEHEDEVSHSKLEKLVDEGPNPEDVQAFSDFVARVIWMERDLERVRLLLRWLRRKIEENEQRILRGGERLLGHSQSQSQSQSQSHSIKVSMTWRQALDQILVVANRLVSKVYGGFFTLD